MRRTLRAKRTLAGAAAGAMVLSIMPAGAAFADQEAVCENAPEDAFDDVTSGGTHSANIDCIAAYDITSGVGGGDYDPLGSVARDQMASFLVQYLETALQTEYEVPEDSPFTDIEGTTHEDNIKIIADLGITEGVTATTYEPDAPVTREQMATFIAETQVEAGVAFDADPEDAFSDDEGSVHEENINTLAAAGIVSGVTNDLYNPDGLITRAQMATFLAQSAGFLDEAGLWEAPRLPTAPGEGPVTLDETSAAAGTEITGTLDNAGATESLSVDGCGFNNEDVEIGGDGEFTLTLPAGQSSGACTLTFSVLLSNGETVEQTVNFTVEAAATETTAAPDLVSASVDGDIVTYEFDQDITGSTPVAADFHVYDAGGTRAEPTGTIELGADGTSVVADFGDAAEDATVATISDGAVTDAAGRSSYASGSPLGQQDLPAGETDGPDLETVDNVRVEGTQIVADFTFDEEVEEGTVLLPLIDATLFQLVDSSSTVFTGLTEEGVSADDRTVTIAFTAAGDVTSVPIAGVVRGVALPGAVEDDDANANVTQTEPRTGDPAFDPGAVADRTDGPDITSVTVAGTDTIAFRFDEAVENPVATEFFIYDNDGEIAPGTDAERSSTDTSVINVEFDDEPVAPVPTVGSSVGAYVEPAAVTSVTDAETNVTHETGLQAVGFTAGRTSLPDLVSVTITVDAFGDNEVEYVFDEDVDPAANIAANFGLVDAQGTLFIPTGGNGDLDEDTVTFDGEGAVGAFTNAQAAAAVIGNVEDTVTAVGTDPLITEGDVPVTR